MTEQKPTRMKKIAYLALIGSAVAVAVALLNQSAPASVNLAQDADDETVKKFGDYLSRQRKSYLTKEEFSARLTNFRKSLAIVDEHNLDASNTFQLTLNKFADWSDEERERFTQADVWRAQNHLFDQELKANTTEPGFLGSSTEQAELPLGQSPGLLGIPNAVDWRQAGAVSTVKNQGGCNGCYAFSSAAALEGITKIKRGFLPDLSTQQIIDCSSPQGNQGCRGGFMDNAFNYLKKRKLQSFADYPYKG